MANEFLFEVVCVLERRIRTTEAYWRKIVRDKHPIMGGRLRAVEATLEQADEVRRSRSDRDVHLYYRALGERYVCVVARHLNAEGFVITAYLTDNIKEGERIWTRSESYSTERETR